QAVPGRDARGPFGQFRLCWNDSRRLLPRESFLAGHVPALIELALELRDPILRRMMRGVGRARRIVGEEGLPWRDRVLHPNPVNAVVSHVLVEEIILRVVR